MQSGSRSHLIAAVLLLGVLVGCGDGATPDADASKVDERSFGLWWDRHLDGADRGDESWEEVHAGSWAAMPIERIELGRMAGYLFESLEIELERGGRAVRRGGMHDWPSPGTGEWVGEIAFHEYAELCWLIDTLDLPRESGSWSSKAFHGEQLELAWTAAGGARTELRDYAQSGPPELHALRAAIEAAARHIKWQPSVEPAPDAGR